MGGNALEAAIATSGVIEGVLNGEQYSFTVPVTALDTELVCAAYGQRRDTWYDHTMTFKSDKIAAGASAPAAAASAEGQQVEVTMIGGTGRVTIGSPAKLSVVDGVNHAEIVWSSSNYIYMLVDGVKYEPVNEEGNSTFVIPVELDTDMTVVGCTVAMSAPREIEYTLRFDSSTIK
jgi:hypothetical protein